MQRVQRNAAAELQQSFSIKKPTKTIFFSNQKEDARKKRGNCQTSTEVHGLLMQMLNLRICAGLHNVGLPCVLNPTCGSLVEHKGPMECLKDIREGRRGERTTHRAKRENTGIHALLMLSLQDIVSVC